MKSFYNLTRQQSRLEGIVDATSEEESQMSSAVSVSVNRQGLICGLTKRGGASLDSSVILDMISVAKHVSEQLMNKLSNWIPRLLRLRLWKKIHDLRSM
ncbi:putative exoribonuclease, phosphorolytic domain 2, PNPase/RNase PH domain superfamily [Helianthus annuus]|nr:putative exoribonuclease, phosphorolytic domain 2, PNPase/RNase PH domain superfamily [Helianthus annuus]